MYIFIYIYTCVGARFLSDDGRRPLLFAVARRSVSFSTSSSSNKGRKSSKVLTKMIEGFNGNNSTLMVVVFM